MGGHIGFVLPLVTHAGGQTTNIADNFSIGFPLGVTFKGTGRMAYLDATVSPGTAYEYQLAVHQPPSGDWITCAVRVNVPPEILPLLLGPARPNPARPQDEIYVSVELASGAPATLRVSPELPTPSAARLFTAGPRFASV